MGQLAASLGTLGAALFIDCRDFTIRSIDLPAADLVVIGSGLRHDHAAGDYRVRRAECDEAARRLGVTTPLDHAASACMPSNRLKRSASPTRGMLLNIT
jgi:galactokinase